MTSGRDEIEHGVDTIVAEAGVTLDARFLGENVVVLALNIPSNLLEATSRMCGFSDSTCNRMSYEKRT